MLQSLRLVPFFICFIVECFKKIFIHCLIIGSIVIYHTPIILNTLNNMAYYIEVRVVKGWSI